MLSSCGLSYFQNDIDEVILPEHKISAPIGSIEFSLNELFSKLDFVELKSNEDNVLSVIHYDTIHSSKEDLENYEVEISDITIGSTINTPITTNDLPSGTFPYTVPSIIPNGLLNRSHTSPPILHDINLRQNLSRALLTGGTMLLQIDSEFDAIITLNLTIPSLINKNSNLPYSNSITLSPNESRSIPIELHEYNANFTHDGNTYDSTYNTIVIHTNSQFDFSTGDVLRETDRISYTALLSDVSTNVVFGDFKQEPFSLSNYSMELDFFDDLQNGTIEFSEAILSLEILNSFGFPIGLNLSGISSQNENANSIELSYSSTDPDEISLGNNITILDGLDTYIPTQNSYKKNNIILDKTNSNINEMLSSKPNLVAFNLSGNANPIDQNPNSNFYASNGTNLQVNLAIEVPLTVTLTDVKIELDPEEFYLGNELDIIKYLNFNIVTNNQIPLSGIIHMNFTNQGTSIGIIKTIPLFDPAPIDSNGESIGTSTTESEISFELNELELLKTATHINLDITFNSPETSRIKLTGKETIKLAINTNMTIDTNEVINTIN